MKLEIEIPEKDLEIIHRLQQIDKDLREQYEKIKNDVGKGEHDSIVQAINHGVNDVNQILLTSIYKNKEWQLNGSD